MGESPSSEQSVPWAFFPTCLRIVLRSVSDDRDVINVLALFTCSCRTYIAVPLHFNPA